MSVLSFPRDQARFAQLDALRAGLARECAGQGAMLAFGVAGLDNRLVGGGLDEAGLHEVAAASPSLTDEAAATLFLAGIAARFASQPGLVVLWALSGFDLYAPGLQQAGLAPDRILYAQGQSDAEVLALAEDGLRSGSLACVVAEVKVADHKATRRLQLAASDGKTPILLHRRHRVAGRCPLEQPSSAMTRWRISCAPSTPPLHAGLGRARWLVELVRQRNGNPFSIELEACDDKGCLALPAATRDRAAATGKASRIIA